MLTDLLNGATTFVDWLATLDGWSVLLVTFLSTTVEMTFLLGLLVPGESVVMLAGSLPDGPLGFALAVAVGTAGALTGQILGYAVGRAFGTRLRATRLGRRIGAERFDRAEAYLARHGAPALVAVRFVAVVHAVVPIVAGTARMPLGRFLGWSSLGTVLWVGAFAGVGAVTAGADSTGGLGVVLTAIGATCLGALPLGARLIRRAFAGGRSAVFAGGRSAAAASVVVPVRVPAGTVPAASVVVPVRVPAGTVPATSVSDSWVFGWSVPAAVAPAPAPAGPAPAWCVPAPAGPAPAGPAPAGPAPAGPAPAGPAPAVVRTGARHAPAEILCASPRKTDDERTRSVKKPAAARAEDSWGGVQAVPARIVWTSGSRRTVTPHGPRPAWRRVDAARAQRRRRP